MTSTDSKGIATPTIKNNSGEGLDQLGKSGDWPEGSLWGLIKEHQMKDWGQFLDQPKIIGGDRKEDGLDQPKEGGGDRLEKSTEGNNDGHVIITQEAQTSKEPTMPIIGSTQQLLRTDRSLDEISNLLGITDATGGKKKRKLLPDHEGWKEVTKGSGNKSDNEKRPEMKFLNPQFFNQYWLPLSDIKCPIRVTHLDIYLVGAGSNTKPVGSCIGSWGDTYNPN